MNLHNEIMNIPVQFPELGFEGIGPPLAYKIGHRDARHAAAELSLKAEARIEELETALTDLYVASGTISNCAYNVGQSHEDWENIKQWIDKLDNARAVAIKVFQEKK